MSARGLVIAGTASGVVGTTLMSCLHLHWGASPGMAGAFVEACAGERR